MKIKNMFELMVTDIEERKEWSLTPRELYLMEKCFLMGIKYEKRVNCSDEELSRLS